MAGHVNHRGWIVLEGGGVLLQQERAVDDQVMAWLADRSIDRAVDQ